MVPSSNLLIKSRRDPSYNIALTFGQIACPSLKDQPGATVRPAQCPECLRYQPVFRFPFPRFPCAYCFLFPHPQILSQFLNRILLPFLLPPCVFVSEISDLGPEPERVVYSEVWSALASMIIGRAAKA